MHYNQWKCETGKCMNFNLLLCLGVSFFVSSFFLFIYFIVSKIKFSFDNKWKLYTGKEKNHIKLPKGNKQRLTNKQINKRMNEQKHTTHNIWNVEKSVCAVCPKHIDARTINLCRFFFCVMFVCFIRFQPSMKTEHAANNTWSHHGHDYAFFSSLVSNYSPLKTDHKEKEEEETKKCTYDIYSKMKPMSFRNVSKFFCCDDD